MTPELIAMLLIAALAIICLPRLVLDWLDAVQPPPGNWADDDAMGGE